MFWILDIDFRYIFFTKVSFFWDLSQNMSSSGFLLKNWPLIGRPDWSANQRPVIWWETTWTHVLILMSEKTDFSIHYVTLSLIFLLFLQKSHLTTNMRDMEKWHKNVTAGREIAEACSEARLMRLMKRKKKRFVYILSFVCLLFSFTDFLLTEIYLIWVSRVFLSNFLILNRKQEEELDSETSSSSEEEPFEEQPQPEQPLLKPEQQKQQQEVIDDDSIEKDADFKITDEENRPSIRSSSQHHTPVLQQTPRGPLKKITSANIINNKLLPSNKKPRRKRRSPRKIKNFEAEDYDEEFEKIRNTGIRTKYHTRDLIRRMIQTTDLNHKVILADLLRSADPPCRRLFIDYRGLFILGK